MRNFIDIICEAEVIPFPQQDRPISNLVKLRGGEVRKINRLPDFHSLDAFTKGYISAALWTEEDSLKEEGLAVDNWVDMYDHLNADTVHEMVEDCGDFQRSNADLLEEYYEHATENQGGYDFWLTRNRHGSGYWDRGLPRPLGDALTKAAHEVGEISLYLGDDGLIYAG